MMLSSIILKCVHYDQAQTIIRQIMNPHLSFAIPFFLMF